MLLTPKAYKAIVDQFGGSVPYSLSTDNFFIVYRHRTKTWRYFTVNDHYEAPERIYMSESVAKAVTAHLIEQNYTLQGQ